MTETAKTIYAQIVALEDTRNEMSTHVAEGDKSRDAEFFEMDCTIADLRDKFRAEINYEEKANV